MAKKKVTRIIKLQLPAGKATPAPPVGTALGPTGVSTPDFVNSTMLMPCGPSAVPTGGAGVALPAGSCRVRTVRIFLATGVLRLPF